MEKKSKTRGLR